MINLISFKEYQKSKDSDNQLEENINYKIEEWSEVKGIGEVLAKRLVENGPYEKIEDVQEISGIKPKIFAAIQEWYDQKTT